MSTPIASVAGVLFSEDRRSVLLIQRRDVPVWVLPGGGVEPGESPAEAIEREMEEETGFTVHANRLVGEYSPVNRLTKQTQLFECTLQSIKKLSYNSECKAIAFFPLNTLPKTTPPPYRDWIDDALLQAPPVCKKLSQVNYRRFMWYLVSHPTLVIRFLLSRLGLPLNS